MDGSGIRIVRKKRHVERREETAASAAERRAAKIVARTLKEVASLTAEQTIRQIVDVTVKTIGRPQPIVVEFNGAKRPFMARIDKVPNVAQQRRGILSTVHLMTVMRGRLVTGDPVTWIAKNYILDGFNKFKELRPHRLTDSEAEAFFKEHKMAIPKRS